MFETAAKQDKVQGGRREQENQVSNRGDSTASSNNHAN